MKRKISIVLSLLLALIFASSCIIPVVNAEYVVDRIVGRDGLRWNYGHYTGDIGSNGLPNGYGTLEFKYDEYVYSDWIYDIGYRDSNGVHQRIARAESFEGNFENGYCKGKGTRYFENGWKIVAVFYGSLTSCRANDVVSYIDGVAYHNTVYVGELWFSENLHVGIVGYLGPNDGVIMNSIAYEPYHVEYKNVYDVGGVLNNPVTSVQWNDTFSVNEPTREGYLFDGWTVTGMDTIDHIVDGITTTETSVELGSGIHTFNHLKSNNGTVTFTAKWIPDTYNIEYALDGGQLPNNLNTTYSTGTASYNQNPTEVKCNETFRVENPTKLGYTFTGWTVSNMDSTSHLLGDVTSSATSYTTDALYFRHLRSTSGTVKFTANWVPNTYYIKYRLDDDDYVIDKDHKSDGDKYFESTPVTEAKYDSEFSVSVPKKTHYNFEGWVITGMDGNTHYIDGKSTKATTFETNEAIHTFKNLNAADGATVTMTAQWTFAYIPHIVKPTCTQRGYTRWTALSGDSYITNYTEPLGHSFVLYSVTDATCTEDGYSTYICERCGITYRTDGEKCAHGDKVWVTTDFADCSHSGEKTAFCSKCGKIIDSASVAPTEHNFVFTVIEECTADHNGMAGRVCTFCGKTVDTQVVKKHTHQQGYKAVVKEPTCSASGEMGCFCSICNACYKTEKIPAQGHCDNPITVIKIPATCTTPGEAVEYCDCCGRIIGSKEIPALGHSDKLCPHIVTKPTCTTDGLMINSCTRCGMTVSKETVSKTGHGSGVWQTSVPATCTTAGEEKLVCECCGAVIGTRETPALGHDDGVWTESSATCDSDGERLCRCTRCGLAISKKATEKTGHDDGVWLIDFEATADHKGQMTRYCSKCNAALETKEFELHTHCEGYRKTVVSPTCTTKGETGIFCEICGAKYDAIILNELGHDYGEFSTRNNGKHIRSCSRCHFVEVSNCSYIDEIIEPTCLEGGYTVHRCSDCSFEYVDGFTAAVGHSFNNWHCCTDNTGGHERQCEHCLLIERAGHCYEGVYNDDETCFKDGTSTFRCRDCGDEFTAVTDGTARTKAFFHSFMIRFKVHILNILHKIQFLVSLDWFLPFLNVR